MLRTFLSVAAAALLISVILLTPASSADTGEATIPPDGHRSWTVEMDRAFTLSYRIETMDGSKVNVMVIPADHFVGYVAGSTFDVVPGAGSTNITSMSIDVELRAGLYYLVVEPADTSSISSEGTTVNYQIDASIPAAEGSSLQPVLGAGALVLLGTILLFFLDMKRRKK